MASKRRIRRRQCDGKRRFCSSREARKAMHAVIRAGKVNGGILHVYRCCFCGGYHFGHVPSNRISNGNQ
ncbi:MAG: hypothetical protein GYA56_02345 [Geobacteraceae bacterium]|nr:hypothetical protein [Geobacteraceae bacterium]